VSVPDSPFEETSNEEESEPSPEPSADPSTSQGPIQRLFDGNADGPPTTQIESDYGVDSPWSLCIRGLVRTATGDGVPPVVEIVLGAGMGLIARQQSGPEREDVEQEAETVDIVNA